MADNGLSLEQFLALSQQKADQQWKQPYHAGETAKPLDGWMVDYLTALYNDPKVGPQLQASFAQYGTPFGDRPGQIEGDLTGGIEQRVGDDPTATPQRQWTEFRISTPEGYKILGIGQNLDAQGLSTGPNGTIDVYSPERALAEARTTGLVNAAMAGTVFGGVVGAGIAGGAGATAAAGGEGVAGLTGAEAIPGYFAGDTAGAMTGGSVLPAAAGGGGMGYGDWLNLATTGLGVAGSIYGANRQADAISDANDEAIKAQQEAEARAAATVLPFTAAGQSTIGRLQGMSGGDFSLVLPSTNALFAGAVLTPEQKAALAGMTFDQQLAFAQQNPSIVPPATLQKFLTDNAPTLRAYQGYQTGQNDPRAPEYQPYQKFTDTGQTVSAPTLDRFSYNGSVVEAPTLGRFSFDEKQFLNDPSYEFRKKQGMEGVQTSAAGRGSLLSGASLKALNEYNSNLASQEYGAAYGRASDTWRMNEQAALDEYNARRMAEADRYGRAGDLWSRNNAVSTDQFNLGRMAENDRYGRELGNWQVGYGQNLDEQNAENQRFTEQWNRLASLANTGQTSATNVSNNAIQAGTNAANLNAASGNARAGSIGATTQSINAGLSDLAQMYSWNEGKGADGVKPKATDQKPWWT